MYSQYCITTALINLHTHVSNNSLFPLPWYSQICFQSLWICLFHMCHIRHDHLCLPFFTYNNVFKGHINYSKYQCFVPLYGWIIFLMCVCTCKVGFSRVQVFANLWTVCSPPGSSVHGILQARTLESLAMFSSRGSSPPGDLPNPGIKPSSLMYPELAGRFFSTSTTWEASYSLYIKILCLSIYPYIDIWLHSTFWLSNAAMRMDVQIPLWDPDFNFLWVFIKLSMKLLNHMVILFNFLRNCHFTCSYIFILIDTCSFFIKAILMIVKW